MPRYMLDADTVSYALRGQGHVAPRLLQYRPSDLCISAVTLAELSFGAEAKRSHRIRRAIHTFTKDVAVLPLDEACAERFGVVAAALATRGQPIGVYDTLVAAQALCLGLTVVTNNTRHFSRVPGLAVENWA
jgi:tRNA(fMet)-specific endonuclease VapC